jgi:hypothetical protein
LHTSREERFVLPKAVVSIDNSLATGNAIPALGWLRMAAETGIARLRIAEAQGE